MQRERNENKQGFKKSLAVFGLLAALCAPAAQAGTITLTGTGLGGDIPLVVNGTPENGFAGQIFANLNGSSIVAYCVDLFHSIGFTSYSNTTGAPSGYSNGQRAAWVLENYGGSVSDNTKAEALQFALWDIVHDGGNGLGAGNVQLDASASTTLRNMANDIILASAGHSSNNALILYNTDAQGSRMQTLITYNSPTATPEPATYAMMGIGIVLIVIGKRASFMN